MKRSDNTAPTVPPLTARAPNEMQRHLEKRFAAELERLEHVFKRGREAFNSSDVEGTVAYLTGVHSDVTKLLYLMCGHTEQT